MNHAPRHTTDIKSMLRNPFGIALVVYYLIMAVVGMLVPDDILKSYPWAREFSDFMAGIVPQIDRVTALNIKPDVNRFYFSVLWAGSPVMMVIVVAGTLIHGTNTNHLDPNGSFTKLIAAVLAGTVMCLAVMSIPLAESSRRLTEGLIGFSLGRGLLGQVVFVNGPIIFLTACWINLPFLLLAERSSKAVNDKRDAVTKADRGSPKGNRNV